jgi:hypothetical protein
MTERIFGPFRDSFDDALSRLEAAVGKSETEAEMLRVAVEQLQHGTHASASWKVT